jgi:hypothetical protein
MEQQWSLTEGRYLQTIITVEPLYEICLGTSFLFPKSRKILNGGCITIKQNYCFVYKNITFTLNLNLVIFSAILIFVFTL